MLIAVIVSCAPGCGASSGAADASVAVDAARVDGGSGCTSDDACDDGRFCNGVESCSARGTCEPGEPPCAGACDEAEDACSAGCEDGDADDDGARSTACGGLDCDDADADRYPGRTEVCDVTGHDEDCDPETYGVRDADSDGWPDARCCNGDRCGTDCDDTRSAIHPTQVDICNTLDDDCDGAIDEAVTSAAWRPDCDGDGYAQTTGTAVPACEAPPAAPAECAGAAGARWSRDVGDCNDASPSVRPTQVDICNATDDDCDGMTDEDAPTLAWRPDCDSDGHGRTTGDATMACAAPAVPSIVCPLSTGTWSTVHDDCDDENPSRYAGGVEVCDGFDNDCDGALDGPGEDDDRDGYADACAGAAATDCNDSCASCHPGAPPVSGMCDGLDHDCDGSVDEGTLRRWYRDADRDGIGIATTRDACLQPDGFAASSGDCNDADTYTGACGAPLTCQRSTACGCVVTLLHGRDYFDLDSGNVIRMGYSSSTSDLYLEWGSTLGSPPIPWYVRVRTSVMHQHLPMTQYSRVDASYASLLTYDPINTYFTPDRVILVRSNAGVLYKLGLPERVIASDGYESLRFVYAPVGTPPPGFACAAPY